MLDELIHFVSVTRYDDLPKPALQAARTFALDSLAVGVAGRLHPHRDAVVRVASAWGEGHAARVLGDALRLPAPSAAFVNAYQIHCLEFDCVHEAAVAHVMTAVVAAALAECEQAAAPPDGRRFLLALILGVEVAALLGLAATAPMTFFRPATTGVFGAAVAVGTLRGFDAAMMRSCLGHALGQVAGTMQAHEEGKPTLPVQLAGAARGGLVAADLAQAKVSAPMDVLEGRYGYFRLFERSWDTTGLAEHLGKTWRVTELSHKPFPCGRATHGGIEGVLRLRHQGANKDNLAQLALSAPPLIHQLVIRPAKRDMEVNYARLCFAYVGAVALNEGTVDLNHFGPAWLRNPALISLAERFTATVNPMSNAAAFVPQTLIAQLVDGSSRSVRIEALLGSPEQPLDDAARRAKVGACLASVYSGAARCAALLEATGDLAEAENAAQCLLDPVTGTP